MASTGTEGREDTPTIAESPGRSQSRLSRLIRAAAKALLGAAIGLGIAEAAFHARDRGAFPHLNLYVSDARLGVRLRPGESQRLLFGKNNPVTSVRVNREGFRGADLPPPSEGEIVVVGDSQVFGLGVEEHETASAALARALGAPVINAGVPTYGPLEYHAVVEEVLARRRVGTVVYVVNMVNDLFEANLPNTERHRVWDGWAVRRETAPASVTSFPGRDLLFRRSHLVYALRGYLHARDREVDERGFASEGTLADLLGIAAKAGDERARAARETEARQKEREEEIQGAAVKEEAAQAALEALAIDTFALHGPTEQAYKRSRDTPGDIVVHYLATPGEESRGPPYVATLLFNGARLRREMEARVVVFAELAEKVEAGGEAGPLDVPDRWRREGYKETFNVNPYLLRELGKGKAHPLVRTLEEREALRRKLAALRAAPAEVVRAFSPMTPRLREVKAACDARGARLLVVALPMDLQVSPLEWSKYGARAPLDMAPTRILLDDLVASAEGIGALGLDATAALAAAEPGAFLDGDIHMSPKGHRALAEAIARKLGEGR